MTKTAIKPVHIVWVVRQWRRVYFRGVYRRGSRAASPGRRHRQRTRVTILRRHVPAVASIGVGFEGIINQLAGVETAAVVFVLMKLNAGGVGVGGLVTFIFQKGGHDFCGLRI